VFREFDKSASDERADLAALSKSLRGDLQAKGLQFVEPDKKAFKATLAKSSFYKDWRGKFGEEAWKLLEDSAGALA
jgi:TRAP-type C4-dicarboxylate transport system substrate-binding protein